MGAEHEGGRPLPLGGTPQRSAFAPCCPPPRSQAERSCARGQGGIVAAADPSQPDFGEVLTRCAAATDMLKGIRWILNCKPNPLCPAVPPRPAL